MNLDQFLLEVTIRVDPDVCNRVADFGVNHMFAPLTILPVLRYVVFNSLVRQFIPPGSIAIRGFRTVAASRKQRNESFRFGGHK
jgi:hypothetical protein